MKFLFLFVLLLACKTRQFGTQTKDNSVPSATASLTNPKDKYFDLVTRSLSAANDSQHPANFEFDEGRVLLQRMHVELTKSLENIQSESPDNKSVAYSNIGTIAESKKYVFKNLQIDKDYMKGTLKKIIELSDSPRITYAQFWEVTYDFLRSCQGENPDSLKLIRPSFISGNRGFNGFIENAPLVFLYPTFNGLSKEDFVLFRPFPLYLIQLTCSITVADAVYPPADFVGHDLQHSALMFSWDLVWLNQAAKDGQIFQKSTSLIKRDALTQSIYTGPSPDELSKWGINLRSRVKEINLDKIFQLLNTRQKYYDELLEPLQSNENIEKIMNNIFSFIHENGRSLGPENEKELLKFTTGGQGSEPLKQSQDL